MNYFLDPITKHYFDFQGVAERKPFWMFFLFYYVIYIPLFIIGAVIHFPFLATIFALAVICPYLGLGVRRMHDVGKSGWWILCPIYNLVLWAQPSTAPYVGQ